MRNRYNGMQTREFRDERCHEGIFSASNHVQKWLRFNLANQSPCVFSDLKCWECSVDSWIQYVFKERLCNFLKNILC
jgi:hypothetical protein